MKTPQNSSEVPGNFSEEETYLCEYFYGGSRWSIDITANSYEEAEAKLRSLSRGKVIGVVKASIPAHLGWIAKLIVAVKNFW